jgi:hypothetical protein
VKIAGTELHHGVEEAVNLHRGHGRFLRGLRRLVFKNATNGQRNEADGKLWAGGRD